MMRKMTSKFVSFLKKLRHDVGGPIIVIADNASYHGGKPVKRFQEEKPGDVVVESLPRYSPELNPDEQVWNHAKSRLGKLFLSTRNEMKAAVKSTMHSIQRNLELVKSFFQLKDTQYAAEI